MKTTKALLFALTSFLLFGGFILAIILLPIFYKISLVLIIGIIILTLVLRLEQ